MLPTPRPSLAVFQTLSQLTKAGQPGRRPHRHASASKHHQRPSRRAFSSGSGKSTPPILMALALAGMSLSRSATWQGMAHGHFPADVVHSTTTACESPNSQPTCKTRPGSADQGKSRLPCRSHAPIQPSPPLLCRHLLFHHCSLLRPISKIIQQCRRDLNAFKLHGACLPGLADDLSTTAISSAVSS